MSQRNQTVNVDIPEIAFLRRVSFALFTRNSHGKRLEFGTGSPHCRLMPSGRNCLRRHSDEPRADGLEDSGASGLLTGHGAGMREGEQ